MLRQVAYTGSHVTLECDHENFSKKRAGKCPDCQLRIRKPFTPLAITFRLVYYVPKIGAQ